MGKPSILTEREFRTRRRQLRLLQFASALPLFGMMAASGIAPPAPELDPSIRHIIETISLPPAGSSLAAPRSWIHMEHIQPGDTLGEVLGRMGVAASDVQDLLSTAGDSALLRSIRPGQVVEVHSSADGGLQRLKLRYSERMAMRIERDSDGRLAFQQVELPVTTQVQSRGAVIKSSLFGATDQAGIPDAIALQMAEILASSIDFHLDLRSGDHFSVVYESFHYQGAELGTGRVLALEFVNRGREHRAVLFEHPQGGHSYYTPEGDSLRKAFLRSPLKFTRISSGFTRARFHPVLKKWRAHTGVDYAAPTGTETYSTADGVVEFVGDRGGYGKLVIVRHFDRYRTYYGHLNGFASGLRKGSRVQQGQLLGYVGQTGLATGPHLHYEFRVGDEPRDPLSVDVPIAMPLESALRGKFASQTQPWLKQLELARATYLARKD